MCRFSLVLADGGASQDRAGDLLATAAGLERGRGMAAPARVAAVRAAGGRPAGLLPRSGRLRRHPRDEGRAGHRSVPGGPGQGRQQASPDGRGARYPARGGHHRRQPQRRDPTDPADPRQARHRARLRPGPAPLGRGRSDRAAALVPPPAPSSTGDDCAPQFVGSKGRRRAPGDGLLDASERMRSSRVRAASHPRTSRRPGPSTSTTWVCATSTAGAWS